MNLRRAIQDLSFEYQYGGIWWIIHGIRLRNRGKRVRRVTRVLFISSQISREPIKISKKWNQIYKPLVMTINSRCDKAIFQAYLKMSFFDLLTSITPKITHIFLSTKQFCDQEDPLKLLGPVIFRMGGRVFRTPRTGLL